MTTLSTKYGTSEQVGMMGRMRLNKAKCWFWHFDHKNSKQHYWPGDEWLESSPGENYLGLLVHSQLNMTQQCVQMAKKAKSIVA